MNKRRLHHLWVRARPIKPRYFLAGFGLSSVVAVWALRQNNLKMIELREAVMEADQTSEGVNEALTALRQQVHSHMNTDLTGGAHPPVQLPHTYERLVKAEQARVAAINKRVAEDAVTVCERRYGVGQLNQRVQCVQDYKSANSVRLSSEVPKELYQFAFVAPRWSPDLAGWSLALAALFLVLFVARLVLEKWLRFVLK
jgi:hypothetical protein